MKFSRLFALLLCCASFTVQAVEVKSETSLEQQLDNQVKLNTTTRVNNWYVTGYNTYSQDSTSSQLSGQAQQQTWFFNGGYQYQLRNELSLFVEAGVNNQYQDLASQRGFNLSTGVSYRPLKNLSLNTKLTQIHHEQQEDPDRGLELSSTYQLIKHVDLKAAYQVEAQAKRETLQQQLHLGLGYRF